MTADNNTPTALDEVLAWLDTIDPIQRARWLGALIDAQNLPLLSGRRVAAVYDATRHGSYAAVAAQLGVSTAAVNKAVTQHKATQARHAAAADDGAQPSTP